MAKNQQGISFLKDSLNLLLIRLSITLANLFVFAYFSHQLSVDQNGGYLNFYVRITMLSVIACAGITMLVYSYSIKTIKFLYHQLRSLQVLLYGLFLTIITTLLLFLHFKEPDNAGSFLYGFCLTVYFISYSINLITDAVITIGKKEKSLVIVNLLYSAAFIGVHIWVLYSQYSLSKIISFLAIISSIKLIWNIRMVHQIFKHTDLSDVPLIYGRRIKNYWSHLFFYDISQVVFRMLDKFFITLIVTAGLSAIYINGTLDIPFIPLIFASVSNTVLIRLNAQKSSNQEVLSSVRYAAELMGTIILTIFFFFFIFRENFIVFFFSDKYIASVPIFAISLFKILTYMAPVTFVLQFKQKGKILNIGAVTDIIISLGLLWPLYHWLELEGVILSFVIGTIVQKIYYTFQTARILKQSAFQLFPLKRWTIRIAVLAAVGYTIRFFLMDITDNNLYLLLTGSGGIGLAGLFFIYYDFIRENKTNIFSKRC